MYRKVLYPLAFLLVLVLVSCRQPMAIGQPCPKPSGSILFLQTRPGDEANPQGISRFDGLSFKPGELLVYTPPLSLQSMDSASLEKSLGLHKLADLPQSGWRIYQVPAGEEKELAQKIIASGLGQYVQPNYKYKELAVPNDPYYNVILSDPSQLGSASQSMQYNLLGITTAWDKLAPSCKPVVGIIDTGVAYDHPDLKANVINGYDFSDNDSDPYPEIDPNDPQANNHGTMVASIIGAVTNNGEGMAGVANNTAYIMPLKVFPNAYSSTIANAINWAIDNGAHVLNMSLCITDSNGECADLTSSPDETIEAALGRAYNSGVVSLAASGNYSQSFVGYPASSAYTIAVGATDNNNPLVRASFSNYGNLLDVVAPGIAVLGAGIPDSADSEPFYVGDGTSFSTPYAAGIVSLYISQYYAYEGGNLPSPPTTYSCIRSAAQDLGAAGFDVYTGMGLVRADNMLDTATNAYGCY